MKIVYFARTTPRQGGKAGRAYQALIVALVALMHGAQPALGAPQPAHNVSAANINVVQNDTANTTNSVTVTTTLSINDMRIRPGSNRGDYNLQVGDSPTNDLPTGLVMTSVGENGRDNGEGTGTNYMASAFDGTAFDGTNELASGY
jgi:hypothetical protein